MTLGLTFDTGALIALERRHQRIARVYRAAVATGVPITVPAVVVAEWWRGRSDAREIILRGVRIEPTTTDLARLAGEALGAVSSAATVDALVMASAARRGDIVYTSDVGDLQRLHTYFPTVTLLAV
jgi:predicted nucleic acid-binding protein